LWGGSWKLGFAYLRNNSYAKSDSWNIMTRYEYPVSKRTTLYGGGGYLWNDDNTAYTISPGGGGSVVPDATYGKSYWTIFAGISHAF
ncbi:MAG: porin, partial [Burkholderiales bacterium]|nr:porin [Burkholderiales bacterium]